jgi:epidermal growth factor receptor substrate 15
MRVGSVAKQIFDRAQLPNDVLIRIWNLADTEQRGKLSVTEFIIAMHLLASFRSGAMRALPNTLPAGLYEAAARRGIPLRPASGSRPTSEMPPISAIPRQFSGGAPRTSSPLARQQYTAPSISAQPTGASDWLIPPSEKTQYDQQFARLDTKGQGYVSGEQAVGFFSNSRLPENDLAQIWDLADITQTGQLNQDEFAVAMHLIRQQLNKKGPLPTTLPANLVPPSMRRQIPPQQQPPVSAQIPASPPRSKSAADDLFGLDALSAPPPPAQVTQSTGGSSAVAPSAPSVTSSPPPQAATHFKPFIPSSTFGQSIMSPQATGLAAAGAVKQTPSAFDDDDLLGDTDPEINKKFSQETTELANLSNQVNNLTAQVKDIQGKKSSNEQELSQVTTQKRDLEVRLAQLRSTYEQEARELKSLQDRLATARNDTTKLQQDLAMAQHSYQQLQEQRKQVQGGLEADQKENASLKDKIAQVYRETNQIKPQIEKMKSEARQQKGLVAINKKQLSTAEAERAKVKTELDGVTEEYNEATRELEESKRELETSRAASPPAAVASPAPSTSSMNPFFRRNTSMSSQGAVQSPFAPPPVASPNHSAFDSFFGNAFNGPSEPKQEGQEHAQPPSLATSTPPPHAEESPFGEPDLPSASHQPPPPPQSRQMTPSSLPLREGTPKAPSSSSSLGVAPPTSHFGDFSDFNTPTKSSLGAPEFENRQTPSPLHNQATGGESSVSNAEIHTPDEVVSPGPKSVPPEIPGAFPVDPTPITSPTTHDTLHTDRSIDSSIGNKNDEASKRSAFDALFGGFGSTEEKGKQTATDDVFGSSESAGRSEFPPIQEFGDDESDSDSDSGHGFDDNFAPVSSPPKSHANTASIDDTDFPKPPLSRGISNNSELPTPNAQKSPPSYGETVSPQATGEHRDSNQFPMEYSGLLPSREDPLASPHPHSQPNNEENPIQTTSVTAIEHTPSIAQPNTLPSRETTPVSHAKAPVDDFDSAFGDLSEAQTADEKTEDDFASSHQDAFDEFNPTFDSPAPSKAPTLENSAFHDFESSFSAPSQSISASAAGVPSRPGPSKDDWDAMFAGFGSEDTKAEQTNGTGKTDNAKDGLLDVFKVPEQGTSSDTAAGTSQKPPSLARAISTGTEHDDPILKHLTSMGYSRDTSLAALEKYDYNLDKAS